MANFLLASEAGLTIMPVINKVVQLMAYFSPDYIVPFPDPQVDLTLADIPGVTEQLNNAFGFKQEEILKVDSLEE